MRRVRDFCIEVLAGLSFLAGCHRAPVGPPPPPRRIPNPPSFVIVIGDQIGFGDLGCYGQKRIATPHIDRLAKEGMRLTEFYAGDPTGAATPWCLLTGRDTAAADRQKDSAFVLSAGQVTLAQVLQRAGYRTGFVGAWTLGGDDPTNLPGQHGFDEWSVLPSTENGLTEFPDAMLKKGTPVTVEANAAGKRGQYVTDLVTQEVGAFLRENPADTPFLLLVVCPVPRSSASLPALETYADTDWLDSRRLYAARVTEFDRAVGSIMEELQQLRLGNRTALMVTSNSGPGPEDEEGFEFFDRARTVSGEGLRRFAADEHGGEFFSSTGGLRGQQGDLHEGGIRVPFVARLPAAFMAGVTRDYAATIWDLLPTLAELSGALAVPKRIDGRSIAPMLRGGIGDAREMLYWEVRSPSLGQAVRLGAWKVVRPPGKTRREDCELYDLSKDPREQRNVAKQHADIVGKFIKAPRN